MLAFLKRFNHTRGATAQVSRMPTEKVVYASVEEERRWNWLSNSMASFHQWFKDEFKFIYESADGSYTARGMSLSTYLDTVSRFRASLHAHHTTEERLVFPILAKKIPRFAHDAENGHLDSHRAIHDGLVDLMDHVSKWRRNPTTYSPEEMKACLDQLSSVLFKHLDQEVEDIKGDNLKPYFKLEEIESIGR